MKHEIVRAEVLGYCMGVRRAVEIAEKSLANNPDRLVFTFGPLIHNKTALANLSERGLCVLEEDEISSVKDKSPVVIIRAHGIPPKIRQKLENAGCILVDATCPRVLANQKKAAVYASKGYTVIIAGDKNHGEVLGLAGCVDFSCESGKNACILVESVEDAEKLVFEDAGKSVCESSSVAGKSLEGESAKYVLIGQTTISRTEYDAIAAVLKKRLPSLEILDTICPATMERQQALEELVKNVDGIIIIGGKNSANTQRLFFAAKEKCPNAIHIESPDEIPDYFRNLKKIGIAAGASTPDEIICAVEETLKND